MEQDGWEGVSEGVLKGRVWREALSNRKADSSEVVVPALKTLL